MDKYMDKLSNWREKAKRRSKEIGALKKRIQEIIESREKWKEKHKKVKSENYRLKKALRTVNKQGNKEVENKKKSTEKPKHHSYSVQVIMFCMFLRQKANCSFRSSAAILKIISLILDIELSFPSRSSIQNWEKKLGYSRLKKEGKKGTKWVLIIDESISIGKQKILLILGVEVSNYKMNSALKFAQVNVLSIGVGASWTGEEIAAEIKKIKARKFSISYGVSDGGTNIAKALKISKIRHVKDCTHSFGNLLKKQYKENELFVLFRKKCGALRREVYLGKNSIIIPPKQRTKGRFLNLQPLSNWAYKMLLLLEKEGDELSLEQREKLNWLKEYKALVLEIYMPCKTMNELFKILKNKGLSAQNIEDCKDILNKSNVTDFFKKGVEDYMATNFKLAINENALICCSDIIESYFGKYKNLLSQTSSQVITDSCLCIANFSQNFDEKEIKKAMEEIKIVDLKNWKQEQFPSSLLQEKRELLKNVG